MESTFWCALWNKWRRSAASPPPFLPWSVSRRELHVATELLVKFCARPNRGGWFWDLCSVDWWAKAMTLGIGISLTFLYKKICWHNLISSWKIRFAEDCFHLKEVKLTREHLAFSASFARNQGVFLPHHIMRQSHACQIPSELCAAVGATTTQWYLLGQND